MDIGEEKRNQTEVAQEVNSGAMEATEDMTIENKNSVVG